MFLEDTNYANVHGALNFKDIGSDPLDGVSEPNELRFTLHGWSAACAIHIVHSDAANLARDEPFVVRHREFKHHPVGIVTDDTAPRERHGKSPSNLGGSRMAHCFR